jgi:hypothetical protein
MIYCVVSPSCDSPCCVAFMQFILLYHLHAIHRVVSPLCDLFCCGMSSVEAKDVTPAFNCQISEASFSDLIVLLVFWFDGVYLNCVLGLPLFSSKGLFFLAPCTLGLSLFSSEVFFWPLVFYSCFFFHQMSFCLAPYILGLPLFSLEVFFS